MQDVVFTVFSLAAAKRRPGEQWWAFGDSDRLHVTGKSLWIALSKSTPLPVINTIQSGLEAEDVEVERELGRALHLELSPFARLSDDGLELLVPAALAGDPTRKRIVERASIPTLARGYRLQPSRPPMF
jgi:N-dimethylarginine dimethylaminohydrolase